MDQRAEGKTIFETVWKKKNKKSEHKYRKFSISSRYTDHLHHNIHLRWKFCTFTFLYGAVFLWHHNSKPSLAVISSTEISWMANRKIIVHIIPNVIFKFPSTISAKKKFTSPMNTGKNVILALRSLVFRSARPRMYASFQHCRRYIIAE